MTLQIVVFPVFAQKNEIVNERPEPVNPMKDVQYYQGIQ
jgi:hypothetical protein